VSYHIYTTKGLILSERPHKEADRIYSILTRDFGLIRAMALGVRKEASKLRGGLEPFSLSRISLVRGKEFWRVTSAQMIEKVSPIQEVVRPLVLLEKLVQGEAAHPELFDVIEQFITSAKTQDESFEINLVAQILFELGYLRSEDLSLDKKALIQAINEGLKHSHLT
jgi:DNA repair protein RecO (recombination protein O)